MKIIKRKSRKKLEINLEELSKKQIQKLLKKLNRKTRATIKNVRIKEI